MSVRAGRTHTCALDLAGTAYCWGNNAAGQLGRGTLSASEGSPAEVPGRAAVGQPHGVAAVVRDHHAQVGAQLAHLPLALGAEPLHGRDQGRAALVPDVQSPALPELEESAFRFVRHAVVWYRSGRPGPDPGVGGLRVAHGQVPDAATRSSGEKKRLREEGRSIQGVVLSSDLDQAVRARLDRGEQTILFTDLVGFTELAKRLGAGRLGAVVLVGKRVRNNQGERSRHGCAEDRSHGVPPGRGVQPTPVPGEKGITLFG